MKTKVTRSKIGGSSKLVELVKMMRENGVAYLEHEGTKIQLDPSRAFLKDPMSDNTIVPAPVTDDDLYYSTNTYNGGQA
jgi:hypothetical protein